MRQLAGLLPGVTRFDCIIPFLDISVGFFAINDVIHDKIAAGQDSDKSRSTERRSKKVKPIPS